MDRKRAGWQHFAEAEWAAARDAFATALEEQPDDPEALDGLGQSLWWLGERDAAIDRRREAYVACQRRGDARRAGGLATYLAGEHRIDGNHASSLGWLSRARRLLAGVRMGLEHGWLAIEEAKRSDDARTAEQHSRAALEIAHQSPILTSNAWPWPSSAARSSAGPSRRRCGATRRGDNGRTRG